MRCFRLRVICSQALAAGVAPCLLLLALGCGSRPAGGGSGAKGSGQFELDVAHCAGFGPAQASSILGVPAEKFQDQSQDLSKGSRWCILANPDDARKGVTFTVSRAESVDEAVTEFQQFRGNAETAVRTIGEKGEKTHEIPGLGDEAVWTPVPGGVYLRKGRYSVQVNVPPDEETQIKIARKILGE